MEEKIRVVVVDDHPMLRKALALTLRSCSDIEVVGEGCNGIEAIEKAEALSPDVIIMDLNLPGKSGLQAISEILAVNPNIRILVFSGTNDQSDILEAIQAGALGFLAKTNQDLDIIKAVRDTFHGMATLQGELLRKVLIRSSTEGQKATFRELLTKRELEIVDLLAGGHSNKTISEKLFLAEPTIRSHINHIINKLNLRSRVDLVRFALTGGLDLVIDG